MQSSFDANSLMERTLHFGDEYYMESGHPLIGWTFLVAVARSISQPLLDDFTKLE